MVGHWTTNLKVSLGEGSNLIIDDFHNSDSGTILNFFEKSNNGLGMEYDF